MGPYKHGASWWVRFRDHLGVDRKLRAGKTRRSADALARRLVDLVDYAAWGQPLPANVLDWAMGLEGKRLQRLVEWGMVSEQQLIVVRPIGVVVDQWEGSMLSRGRGEGYVQTQGGRVRRLCEAAGYGTVAVIEAEGMLDVLNEWRRLGRVPGSEHRRADVSESTLSHYVRAMKAFTRWVSRPPRGSGHDVLSGLRVERRASRSGRTVSNQARRRALSEDEQRGLIEGALRRQSRSRMGGKDRAMLYRVALGTGLRLSAIRRLRVQDLDCEGYVRARGGGAANKRTRTKPVSGGLMRDLLEYVAGRGRDQLVFGCLLDTSHIAETVRADAAAGGVDTVGVDFHCLRHSYGTSLARRGVHPKTLMELMDHSSIELTMRLYVHSFPDDEVRAVHGLPDLGDSAKLAPNPDTSLRFDQGKAG
ncbi:MAG: site-specific integrase [Planctomycetota bacterium]